MESFFDPCPLKHDLNKWNGLEIEWKDVNFINPPYNNKDKVAFIKKAYEESLKGKTCIILIPSSTELPIFHDLILPYAEVRFIRGRVKFKGFNSKGIYTEKGTGQMGSMFVIFKLNSETVMIKTCATKHVIPPKSKDSGILSKFT